MYLAISGAKAQLSAGRVFGKIRVLSNSMVLYFHTFPSTLHHLSPESFSKLLKNPSCLIASQSELRLTFSVTHYCSMHCKPANTAVSPPRAGGRVLPYKSEGVLVVPFRGFMTILSKRPWEDWKCSKVIFITIKICSASYIQFVVVA